MNQQLQDFLKQQIASVEARIVAYEAAAMALADGVQSYKLDTGQNVQNVTMVDLEGLQRTLESLYNQLDTLCARAYGGGSTYVRPAW